MPRSSAQELRPTIAARDGRRLPAYLTVTELAVLVGVSSRAVRKACAAGRVESWTVEHGEVTDYVIPVLAAGAWARARERRLSVDDVLAAVGKSAS